MGRMAPGLVDKAFRQQGPAAALAFLQNYHLKVGRLQHFDGRLSDRGGVIVGQRLVKEHYLPIASELALAPPAPPGAKGRPGPGGHCALLVDPQEMMLDQVSDPQTHDPVGERCKGSSHPV